MTAVHRSQTSLMLGVLIAFGWLVGCSNRGSVEILETQLRDREDQIAELQTELEDKKYDLRAAQEEAVMLWQQLTTDERVSSVELMSGVVRVHKIRIHPLLTGPLDTNDDGSDDELIVLVQPRDERDKTVKAIGALHVELSKNDRPVDQWTVSPQDASQQWRDSKPGAGMMLRLPLGAQLPGGNYSLNATLETANDRTFTATHTFVAN